MNSNINGTTLKFSRILQRLKPSLEKNDILCQRAIANYRTYTGYHKRAENRKHLEYPVFRQTRTAETFADIEKNQADDGQSSRQTETESNRQNQTVTDATAGNRRQHQN